MMSGYGCDDLAYSAVIPPYFANGVCVLAGGCFTVYTIYALLFHNFSSKLAKTVRALQIVTLLSLFLAICLTCITVYRYYQCPSNRLNDNSNYTRFLAVSGVFRYLALFMIEISFLDQFIRGFKDSIIEIPSTTIFRLKSMVIIQLILLIAASMSMGLFPLASYLLILLIILLYIITTLIIILQFIKYLKIFVRLFKNSSKYQVKQQLIYNVAKRKFLCHLNCIISTLIITIIVVVILTIINRGLEINTGLYNWTLFNIDNFINVIFLMFQWPFSTNIYNKFCLNCQIYQKCLKLDKQSHEKSELDRIDTNNPESQEEGQAQGEAQGQLQGQQ